MEDLDAIVETGGAAAAELAAAELAKHGGRALYCPSCGHKFSGPYCAQCGQPRATHRRSIGHLAHDFFLDLASFDSRILRTARALLFQPGELSRAFAEGRTQRYVPAVRLYLFVSLLFFLTLAVSRIAIVQFALTSALMTKAQIEEELAEADSPAARQSVMAAFDDGKTHYSIGTKTVFFNRVGEVKSELSPQAREKLIAKTNSALKEAHDQKEEWIVRAGLASFLKLASDPAALNGALTAWIPRALFLLLPAFALLLAAFYWRQSKSFYFVDHLVFSLNFHSFGFIALLAAAALAQVLPGWVIGWFLLAGVPLYLFLAMRRFYKQNWFWTGAKFAGLSFIYTFFFVFPAFGAVIALSVLYG